MGLRMPYMSAASGASRQDTNLDRADGFCRWKGLDDAGDSLDDFCLFLRLGG
jgi:hypothetical protein